MKKVDVRLGAVYVAKVSGQVSEVRIENACPSGGWWARHLRTDRRIKIRGAQRLRREVTK